MSEFRMPSLGADMTEGTLIEWLVAPGDTVRRGQIVAVIDTVKSAVDIEAFEDGEVQSLLVEPGTTVTVGTPLALLGAAACTGSSPVVDEPEVLPQGVATKPAGGPAPASVRVPVSPIVRHLAHDLRVDLDTLTGTGPGGGVTRHDVERAAAAGAPADPQAPASSRPSAVVPAAPDGARVPASPLARTRADRLGIDLAEVTGSGPGGAVTLRDVEDAGGRTAPSPTSPMPPAPANSLPRAPAPTATRPGAGSADARKKAMQAATGALMARSKREIPHYYLERTLDLSVALAWLSRHNEGRPSSDRVLPAALLLRATARCLRDAPELNGFYTEDGFDPHDEVDLGVAVSRRGGGLVVANLRAAHARSVDELMASLKDMAVRARAGRLTSSEISVPTITVTNLGDQGADLVHGVIYPPQVALVGFGRISERPWAVNGMLTVRPVVVATLAADHRVSDGHRGSRFLAAVDAALQTPEEL